MIELNLVSSILSGNFSNKIKTLPVVTQGDFNPLSSPDILFSGQKSFNSIQPFITFTNQPFTNALSSNNIVSFADQKLQILQQKAIQSADKEWRSEVKETGGNNRSPRIDQYCKNGDFGVGAEWCGFFASFNYSQSGFKYPSSFSGMRKTRDFFLYRQYTDRSPEKNAQMEKLRETQKQEGSERQFFLMKESPSIPYLKEHNKVFNNYDIDANTFDYKNLPIRTGDIALFYPGHIAMVVSYDSNSGKLVTIEGNTSGKTVRGKTENGVVAYKERDLSKASVREKISGFGRPAAGDFK